MIPVVTLLMEIVWDAYIVESMFVNTILNIWPWQAHSFNELTIVLIKHLTKDVNYITKLFVCLFCCFKSQVHSYDHGGTVSSPNHISPGQA